MPKKYGNRIKVNSATTGTGVISLGTAVEGYQNFSSGGITDGSSVSYVIEDGANFEIGVGTYTASGTTLSRTVSESTNSNNAINLSGEAVIFITPAASDLPFTDGASFSGAVTFSADVTFDGATAGYDIVFDRSDNALEFADGAKATFGSALTINTTNLTYNQSGSSNFQLISNKDIDMKVSNQDRITLRTSSFGGQVELYNAGSKKFETSSTGVNVIGVITDDGATHDGDVTFTGASYSAVWDKSDSALEFADNAKATFGSSRKVEIYSNGTMKNVLGTGTGSLLVKNSGDIYIQDSSAGTKTYIAMASGGSVELYTNGIKKFETSSSGVNVIGNIAVSGTVDGRDLAVDGTKLDGIAVNATSNPNALNDLVDDTSPQLGGALQLNGNNIQANDSTSVVNNRIQLGTSQDLQLYHNGTNSSIENVTGQLDIINSAENQDVVIKSDDGFGNLSEYFRADGSNGSARLFHYGSEKISTRGDGVVLTGNIINTSGDMTLDVAGDLALDVGGATIFFKDDGATWGYIENQTTDGAFDIKSSTNNYDMRFRGTDNGSTITALTLDMSNAGAATFNDDVKLSDYKRVKLGNGGDLQLLHDGGGTSHISNYTGHLYISNYSDDADIKIQTDNGQGSVTDYILADGSDGSVHLMHYGSTKLQTLNTGVNVSGDITFDASSDEKVGAESSRTFLTGNLGSQLRAGNNTKVAATTTGVELTGATVQNGDFTFTGASYNAVWDKSANSLRFADNAKAVFGDGSDASIHWNGSALEFSSELGDVLIRGNNEIKLQAHTGENFFVGLSNGASTLYYDNSAKLATSSSGVTITGTLAATAVTGDGSGLTNVSASDSTKMPLSGGTFTGGVTLFTGTVTDRLVLNDNVPLHIGTGHDFSITHNGTNTIITGNAIFEDDIKIKTGGILAFTTSSNVNRSIIQFDGTRTTWTNISAHPIRIDGKFEVVTGSSSIASFEDTGVDLYYANSKKFETTSSGVTVTGDIANTSGDMSIKTDGTLYIADENGHTNASFSDGGAAVLYNAHTERLRTNSTGVNVSGTLSATAVTGDGSGLTNLPSSFPASGGTFTGDVTFTGANYDTLFFDASANDLIFKGAFLDLTWDANNSYLSGESNVRFRLGDSNNLQLYHGGPYDNYNYIKNTSPLRIKGDNVTFMRTNNHILYDMSPTAHTFKISNANKFVVDANGADLQGDFQFNGGSSDLLWDSSDNKLKFDASTGLSMGTNGEFEIIQFSTQAQIGMGTGQVTFKGGDTFTLNDGQGNRNRIVSTSGTSGTVSLYYGANNKKLETASTGITVTGDVNSTSDIRAKKNIETIEDALEKVSLLRGVTFDWDNDVEERATGVIAQDVEKVLPEAVRDNAETGFKSVAYGNMVGLLVEAIKEQQTQIDKLEAQVKKLIS
jgi:hypothetical protein